MASACEFAGLLVFSSNCGQLRATAGDGSAALSRTFPQLGVPTLFGAVFAGQRRSFRTPAVAAVIARESVGEVVPPMAAHRPAGTVTRSHTERFQHLCQFVSG